MRRWILFSLLLLLPALGQDYRAAVEDARIVEPGERATVLALRADTPGLVWEGRPGSSRLLMLRWTRPGELERDTILKRELFLTAVPEIADWFRSRGQKPTVARLEQLLGLPPGNGKTHFVELWVWPGDLFRPSPDPEVDDAEVELDFRPDAPRAHVRWMSDRTATCYVPPSPYPWTRLGYTYDWGSPDRVGVSEFVARAGARVGVRRVVSNQEWFRELSAPPAGSHVGVHGMIVFGPDRFSHLPMFHEPHDYQAILEVRLSHRDLPAGKSFGDELHTFVPERLSLGDLLSGRRTRFVGTLYRGNFEAGGQPLLEGVEVEVGRIAESRRLDGASRGPAELNYTLYGSPGDTYLVHPIHGSGADFDQILKVRVEADLGAEELRRGVPVVVPGQANTVEQRLVAGDGRVRAGLPEQSREVYLVVERELSCLVGPDFTRGPGPR